MNKKVILMILDGWGKSPDPKVSAIDQAHTPFIDSLYNKYANASLRTDGLHVGLPEGQMGNSEVGHMNLGAGRIVYQDLVKINLAIENKTLASNKVLQHTFKYAKENNKPLHLLGLLSDGGVHAHINHLFAIIEAANQYALTEIYIHAFTDGRDVDPKSGLNFISSLQAFLKNKNGKIASITGRYFAMDRDQRWERTKLAYDALVNGIGQYTENPISTVKENYHNNCTDEFIKPIVVVDKKNQPVATIKSDDAVLFFNFRTDRGRQLTQALTQQDFHEWNMHKLRLHFSTMTNYDDTFKGIHVLFEKDNLSQTLGEVLAKNHKKQLRIAETEKYPHVTFFFSGGREKPFEGEQRILKNSPKVATYDLKPEMSAYELRDALLPIIQNEEVDFVCLNFANGDMVGHTGVMKAAIKACEAVDECVRDLVTQALAHHYTTLLIADHGNCETMMNPDGSPHTAHTTNPVPVILIDNELKHINSGILANIAPTILKLMGIPKPDVMTQNALL
ncbi:MAG TPA: 2,3-bisphosphoglycerate-independent phosphoglycerate mutase [Flavobacteriaceae bacterium]|nr:2,3-bisphosphoglycerate-independent phosphoglycerate mutase [Flavobacteriaceae bacterium]